MLAPKYLLTSCSVVTTQVSCLRWDIGAGATAQVESTEFGNKHNKPCTEADIVMTVLNVSRTFGRRCPGNHSDTYS